MRILFIFIFISIVLTSASQQQIDPIKQNIIYKIDQLGNCDLEVSMQLNAIQWNNYKQSLGGNVSLLKREIERQFPGYFLQDFKAEEKEMERIHILNFKAIGFAKLQSKERWMIEIKFKNLDITPVSDDTYLLISNFIQNGVPIQVSSKIIFPKGVKNIKKETDAFGNSILTYDCQPSSFKNFPFLLVGGICMLLGSGVGYYLMHKQGTV